MTTSAGTPQSTPAERTPAERTPATMPSPLAAAFVDALKTALLVIGLWIVLQLFSGIGSIANTAKTAETGGVAYMAHIGGFFAGVILAFVFRETRRV